MIIGLLMFAGLGDIAEVPYMLVFMLVGGIFGGIGQGLGTYIVLLLFMLLAFRNSLYRARFEVIFVPAGTQAAPSAGADEALQDQPPPLSPQ
jgi:hypothetical protein